MNTQQTPGPWHVFCTIAHAGSPHGVEIGAGINSFGDGPEKIVGRMFGFSDADKAVALAGPELLAELIALRRRFHSACRSWHSEEEFVAGSTPGADAAIAKATNSAPASDAIAPASSLNASSDVEAVAAGGKPAR